MKGLHARAVIGAFLIMLSMAFVASALFTDDWYSGHAERGTEAEEGWWNASVEYGLFNRSIWVGTNDNLFGIPHYEVYNMNSTGVEKDDFILSFASLFSALALMTVTFAGGILAAGERIGGKFPLIFGFLAALLVVLPGVFLCIQIPGIVERDLESVRLDMLDPIPDDEMHILESNLTRGTSFTLLCLSLPGLLFSPLLFTGIRKRKTPSIERIAGGFFREGTREENEEHEDRI